MAENVPSSVHARPPEALRTLFKKWQKASLENIENAAEILDTKDLISSSGTVVHDPTDDEKENIVAAFCEFGKPNGFVEHSKAPHLGRVYGCEIPGLYIFPSLLPDFVQCELLNKVFHRDLSDPQHQTNLHLHYEIPYPPAGVEAERVRYLDSFFNVAKDKMLHPKDTKAHKPMTIEQMLQKKLRWITLGGQYDWTAKAYPDQEPPKFPGDVSSLLKRLFPTVDAQAAIVNLYAPGDTLSVHRDVSEECDRGLISISIGCDGIFLIGNEDGSKPVILRLRSGDAILMTGQSRFAWHAVPKIIPNTCPDTLQSWPQSGNDSMFSTWKNWLSNKRINLNVRQMKITPDVRPP